MSKLVRVSVLLVLVVGLLQGLSAGVSATTALAPASPPTGNDDARTPSWIALSPGASVGLTPKSSSTSSRTSTSTSRPQPGSVEGKFAPGQVHGAGSEPAKVVASKPSAKEDQEEPLEFTHVTNEQWLKLIEKNGFDAPSDGPYPEIENWKHVWIEASISKQRIYIKQGSKTLYTMLTSTGIAGHPTPTGTFYVQAQRGTYFYSNKYQEGAKYWTSWLNHGEYLFHSVPVDKNGNLIKSNAEDLGEKASHGCFHLTFADAKWIYEHVPTGTKVVVHQ